MELICGIDEAGRGCIAGSLFVAGVVCMRARSEELFALGVADSKKLSRAKRFALESTLLALESTSGFLAESFKLDSRLVIAHHIVQKSAAKIDEQGLSAMLAQALEEIMAHFAPICQHFVFDGNTTFGALPPKSISQSISLETLIKGDSLLAPIACASILAKCAKDREGVELDTIHPHYGLAKHAGYGTKAHYEAIARHGLTPIHRKSFIKSSVKLGLLESI